MRYEFKLLEEAFWAALVAAAVAVLQVLATEDLSTVTDWRTWVIAVGAGAVRAAAGAMLARLQGGQQGG